MFNETRFRLRVHQYGPGGEGEGGGGSPGGPGGPGGTGPSGTGGGSSGGNVSTSSGFGNLGFSRDAINLIMDFLPGLNLAQGLMMALNEGKGFGDIAQGDPNFSPGNTGPGTTGAQGGGPTVSGPVSQTSRAITQAVAAPAPVETPVTPPLVDDRQRKRVGRQETILTSRSALSDAPTIRPTLLGQ